VSDNLPVETRGGARPGAGAPKKHTRSAADRMRLTRRRRQLARLQPFYTRGLISIARLRPKWLDALKAILDNPAHEDHYQAIALAARLDQEARREIYDRTGLVKRLEVDAEISGRITLTPEDVAMARERAAELMAQDETHGDVKAINVEYEIIPPGRNGEPAGETMQ